VRVSEKLAYEELAMSMGPVGGVVGSAAGTSLSQTAGAETERSQRDTAAQHRQIDGNERTEQASGIGQTEEDQESSERDADGRRLWERPAKRGKNGKEEPASEDAAALSKQSKDPSGQSGTKLDLTG
jgi:hypothetical protein